MAVQAARAALKVDRKDAAEYWYERALESDPNGVTAITEAAEFFALDGDLDRVFTLMQLFESLGSSNTTAWKAAERIYVVLGDSSHAERAAACYGAGGVTIPDDC